jgi:hypothetical protein
MTPTIFLRKHSLYTAIKDDCDTWENLGIIGEGSKSGAAGLLNAKQELCDAIINRGGNLLKLPSFILSPNGRMRNGSGSGYVGWKDFGSEKAVLHYLEQYFSVKQCETPTDNDSRSNKSRPSRKDSPKPSSGERRSSAMDSLQILADIGFKDIAQWEVVDHRKLRDLGDDVEVWRHIKLHKNALYAFYEATSILYIGKTARSIEKRFVGYRDPGKTRATNWKCHQRIRRLLNQKKTVRIMVLPDETNLQWGSFRINLAAGLEDALVEALRPELNGKGANRVTESEQLEAEAAACN